MTEHSAEALITAENLTIGYTTHVISGPINLSITSDTALGIIGSNGSGKSTLVHTLLGILPPLEGHVNFQGSGLNPDLPLFRQHVAVQVNDGVFFEDLTVGEHLEMVARGHRLDNWKSAVANELEFFDLQQVAEHLPHELSSGQRRKLLLAATLIRPAKLIVLDEPEQRLDWQMRQKLYDRLAALHASGTGILAVTHDPGMIRTCLPQVLLMETDGGQLLDATQAVSWLER